MSTKMVTPELDKLTTPEWKAITGFLEFLSNNHVWLARDHEYGEEPYKRSELASIGGQEKLRLVHGYFGTTPEKCEAERIEMLRRVRYSNDKEREAKEVTA